MHINMVKLSLLLAGIVGVGVIAASTASAQGAPFNAPPVDVPAPPAVPEPPSVPGPPADFPPEISIPIDVPEPPAVPEPPDVPGPPDMTPPVTVPQPRG